MDEYLRGQAFYNACDDCLCFEISDYFIVSECGNQEVCLDSCMVTEFGLLVPIQDNSDDDAFEVNKVSKFESIDIGDVPF